MAERTEISWCDATFNPWTGCTKVSPGCDGCYAESWSKRAGSKVGKWGPGAPRVRTTAANWRHPEKWNDRPYSQCPSCGWRGERKDARGTSGLGLYLCPLCDVGTVPARRRVFCASLADVFDNEVPQEWRRDLFNLILSTPSLDWLLLTKRIGNAARMIEETLPDNMKALPPDCPVAWPWPNVWIGATIVNQEEADRDIPKLLAVPARVRFLSMEPLLGPVDLTWCKGETFADAAGKQHHHAFNALGSHGLGGIQWVIVGGESGPHARPMHPDWARILRDQCATAGVPFHFKQWGEWAPGVNFPEHVPASTYTDFGETATSEDECSWRVGKKAAGRLLDGIEHNGFPEVAS